MLNITSDSSSNTLKKPFSSTFPHHSAPFMGVCPSHLQLSLTPTTEDCPARSLVGHLVVSRLPFSNQDWLIVPCLASTVQQLGFLGSKSTKRVASSSTASPERLCLQPLLGLETEAGKHPRQSLSPPLPPSAV